MNPVSPSPAFVSAPLPPATARPLRRAPPPRPVRFAAPRCAAPPPQHQPFQTDGEERRARRRRQKAAAASNNNPPDPAAAASSPTSSSSSSSSSFPLSLLPSVLTSPLLPRLVPLARALWRAAWLALMAQLAPTDPAGRYVRPPSSLPDDVRDVAPPPATAPLTLYASPACPWCHRVTVAAALLQTPNLAVVPVEPGPDGLWRVRADYKNAKKEAGLRLRDRYLQLDPQYQGRFTAPLLVDDAADIIVSNESADILRILHLRALDHHPQPPVVVTSAAAAQDPAAATAAATAAAEQQGDTSPGSVSVCLRPDVDTPGVDAAEVATLCDRMYGAVNDGVYRCGFATSQLAYDEAETQLFDMLDQLEARLATSRFLCSEAVVTEADVRLFPTAFRFDSVYATIFRVSRKSIRADYPAIAAWMKDMYNLPGVAETCDLQACAVDYFANLFPLNASGVVPRVALPSYLTSTSPSQSSTSAPPA